MKSINTVFLCVFLFIISMTSTSIGYSSESTSIGKVEKLFRTMDVKKISGNDFIRFLEAKFLNPNASTNDVNQFDSFSLMTDKKLILDQLRYTVFDANQHIIHTYSLPGPWVGVDQFRQAELPKMTFEEGLVLTKMSPCSRGLKKVVRFIIYKTQNSQQIVYDYIFQDPTLPKNKCQEVLFTPEDKTAQQGMVVNCRIS